MEQGLFGVKQAVQAIAEVLQIPYERALGLTDPRTVQIVLDAAYLTGNPSTTPVSQATAVVLVEAATRMPASRERVPVGIAYAFAQYHGADINWHPMRLPVELVSRVRDGDLGLAEVTDWMRQRTRSDRMLLGKPGPRPASGSVTALGYRVTGASESHLGTCDKISNVLLTKLTAIGGQLLRPLPRFRNGQLLLGESLDDADVRHNSDHRQEMADVVVVVGDLSAGCGLEADAARKLRTPVLYLTQSSVMSPWMTRPGIHVLPYTTPESAAAAVVQWQIDNRWTVLNANRRRHDRPLLWAERWLALTAAWTSLDDAGRAQHAALLSSSVAEIDASLRCVTGLAVLSAEQLEALHAVLGVSAPMVRLPARLFDEGETEALISVALSHGILLPDAMGAAMDLLTELALPGQSRDRLNGELWIEYLKERGLIGD